MVEVVEDMPGITDSSPLFLMFKITAAQHGQCLCPAIFIIIESSAHKHAHRKYHLPCSMSLRVGRHGMQGLVKGTGSVPCPWKPELAYRYWVKSPAFVTGFVLAEGTHQTLVRTYNTLWRQQMHVD